MNQSFSEIYKAVEQQYNDDISYSDYLTVVEALEWKHKSGILVESLEKEDDLVYWVETVRTHNTDLNEKFGIKDFSNLITKTKEKAIKLGKDALKISAEITSKFMSVFGNVYEILTKFSQTVISNVNEAANELFKLLKEQVIFKAFNHLKQMVATIPPALNKMYSSYKKTYDATSEQIFGFVHRLAGGKEIDDPEEAGKKIRESDLHIRQFQKFLDKNPKLKFGVGVGVAWMLYKIWTIMVFKGDFIFDFNLITALDAFVGKLDLSAIFGGPGGVELITWFGLAYVPGMPSAAWLDGDLTGLFGGWGNHILAGVVTLFYYIAQNKEELFKNPILKAFQLKVCSAGKETPDDSKELVRIGKEVSVYINKAVCKATGGSTEGEELSTISATA